MIRRPPTSTRTDTCFPYTTLFRSTRCSKMVRAATVCQKHPSIPGMANEEVRLAILVQDANFVMGKVSAQTVMADFIDHFGRLLAYKLIERSEEHTSELQSLMRISYAVFCLKKKKNLSLR